MYFIEENIEMTNTQIKNCSTLLAIREMQIKATVGYYCTPIRMAKLCSDNTKCWRGQKLGSLITLWLVCKKAVRYLQNDLVVPLKTEHESTIPPNCIPGYLSQNEDIFIQKPVI